MEADTLARYTGPIDALCLEAAHSNNEYDIPVVLAILAIFEGSAESSLGYDHTLSGEANGECIEDSRVDYWYPKFSSIAYSGVTFDEKVALTLALHRGAWYLRRVKIYGSKVFDPSATGSLDF